MARRTKVDLVNAQKDIKLPNGISVTWHNKETPKAATITAATDAILDEFKVNAKSTTEIIPKFEFTPVVVPDLPIDPDAVKRQQAEDNWDALKEQERIDGIQSEFDKL